MLTTYTNEIFQKQSQNQMALLDAQLIVIILPIPIWLSFLIFSVCVKK